MDKEIKIMLDSESLSTLLRANLSCFVGKNITHESLKEITEQIIESINYFLSKKDE